MANHEQVYARMLARVDRAELQQKCRDVAQKEAKSIDRRLRGARRTLQHAYDLEAARRQLGLATHAPATDVLLEELAVLQQTVAVRMHALAKTVGCRSSLEEISTRARIKVNPNKPPLEHAAVTPTTSKRRKRRLRCESIESPRKPPRPGRLAMVDDETTEDEQDEPFPPAQRGPHARPSETDDEATEDDVPMHLDVLDSDTEFDMAAYLEKARHLRKISSERRMGELPGLIDAVLAEMARHEWATMPRELLGTLSATLSAATTLKPAQRLQLHAQLSRLRDVALQFDEDHARLYPTLQGSRARFLSSIDDLPHERVSTPSPVDHPHVQNEPITRADEMESVDITELHAATSALACRTVEPDELRSMEQIEHLLTLVDHVFDNPTLARSPKYFAMVANSLDVLISYVDTIERTTRRKLQCEDLLRRRRAQLTGLEV